MSKTPPHQPANLLNLSSWVSTHNPMRTYILRYLYLTLPISGSYTITRWKTCSSDGAWQQLWCISVAIQTCIRPSTTIIPSPGTVETIPKRHRGHSGLFRATCLSIWQKNGYAGAFWRWWTNYQIAQCQQHQRLGRQLPDHESVV